MTVHNTSSIYQSVPPAPTRTIFREECTFNEGQDHIYIYRRFYTILIFLELVAVRDFVTEFKETFCVCVCHSSEAKGQRRGTEDYAETEPTGRSGSCGIYTERET